MGIESQTEDRRDESKKITSKVEIVCDNTDCTERGRNHLCYTREYPDCHRYDISKGLAEQSP